MTMVTCNSPIRSPSVKYELPRIVWLALIAAATVSMRVAADRLGWLSSGFAQPLRGGELMDLLTGWAIPLYAGSVAAERCQGGRFPVGIACAFIAACGLFAIGSVIEIHSPGTALVSMSVSIVTGATLSLVWQAWNEPAGASRDLRGSAGTGSERRCGAEVPVVLLRRTALLLAAAGAALFVAERELAATRFTLPGAQRAEVAAYHGVVFVAPT